MEENRKLRKKPMLTWSLIYDKGAKNTQQGKGNKRCWTNWKATCKRTRLDQFLTPYTQTNSKGNKDLNASSETMKFLEENLGSMLLDIGLIKNFFDESPQAMATKAKMNKQHYIKLKKTFPQ